MNTKLSRYRFLDGYSLNDCFPHCRLIPVLRGSTPQEGDPLGIYPGGGLDSRIDPSLVPEARAQLGDEVRLLQTQLEILTRRLGVSSRGRDNTLDAGLLL